MPGAKAARSGEKAARPGEKAASAKPAAKSRPHSGRATPTKKSLSRQQQSSGRYTPPIPRTVRRSPPWYPYVLLTLLVLGVVAIILDYTELAPGAPSGGYVVGGIGAILVAALMATRYH